MDASLRGLRPQARADDVVVVRAGRSVRSVYDDEREEGEAGRRLAELEVRCCSRLGKAAAV